MPCGLKTGPPACPPAFEVLDSDDERPPSSPPAGGADGAAKRRRLAQDRLPSPARSAFAKLPLGTGPRGEDEVGLRGAAPDDPPLTDAQERLLEKVLLQGQSVFFTGAAGTGKSLTMRELIRRAPEDTTFVTALTGMAATHLPRGTTLHSFAGVGLAKGTKEQLAEKVLQSQKAVRNWLAVKILIVDEASMMSKGLFEKLEYVARRVRRKEQPFGGVVLCLCGDFYQLPPVSRGPVGDDALFCFESDVWAKCLAAPTGGTNRQNCFSLTQVFRQKDPRLLDMLSQVRHNSLKDDGLATLNFLKRPLVEKDGIKPTKLFATNAQADKVNADCLRELKDPQTGEVWEATYEAAHWKAGPNAVPYGFADEAAFMDAMSMYPRRLELKVGAQVMLLKNTSATLVNGSRGVVEGFELYDDEHYPRVRFLSGEEMLVTREEDSKDGRNNQKVTRAQVPLRLSWAITIHKAQGMSIDCLQVDLRNVFEKGQAYVALSRARTIEGLQVLSFDPGRFWTSPKVAEFYEKHVQQI